MRSRDERMQGDAEAPGPCDYDGPPGFCYIDEVQNLGNPALLEGCPATERRKLQFVGENTPLQGAMTFVVCELE